MINDFIKDKLNLLLNLSKSKIYIVGGFVRENILGNLSKDIDLILTENISEILDKFSRISRGALITLDKEREIFRINWKSTGICFDFSPIKNNLKEDLLSRDLTINSLAIELNNDLVVNIDKRFPNNLLIDYCDGFYDIENRIIRTISSQIIKDDPLRLLRIFRFSAKFNFSIEEKTFEYIYELSNLIKDISKERVLKEITEILSFRNTYKYISSMFETNLYQNIFNQFSDNKDKIINALKNIESIQDNLNIELENIYILKLTILFIFKEKLEKKELEKFLRELKLSHKEFTFIIKQKIYFDLLDLNNINTNNKTFLFYFFRERKDILKESLIIYLSIFYNTKYYNIFEKLYYTYLNEKILYEHTKIIDGNIIKKYFPNIQDNKIGLVLEKINLFQALCEVNSLNDALSKIEFILTHPEGLEPPTH